MRKVIKIIALIFVAFSLSFTVGTCVRMNNTIEHQIVEIQKLEKSNDKLEKEVKEMQKSINEKDNIIKEKSSQIEEKDNIIKNKQAEVDKYKKQLAQKNSSNFKLISYYANDGYETGSCTGSGLCVNDFEVNEKGWYTYDDKLVLAGATEELFKTGYSVKGGNVRQSDKHYFNYYDTLTVNIDGTDYEGIIVDSCGASLWQGEHRLDLFVSSKNSAITRKNVEVSIDEKTSNI